MTLLTVAHQAFLSKGFSRQEYWSGLQYSSPGDLPDPGIELRSPTLQADSLCSEPHEVPFICSRHTVFTKTIFLVIYGHWSVLSINYLSSDMIDFFKWLLPWACMWLLHSTVSRGTFQSLYSCEMSLPSFSIQALGMSVVFSRWFFYLFCFLPLVASACPLVWQCFGRSSCIEILVLIRLWGRWKNGEVPFLSAFWGNCRVDRTEFFGNKIYSAPSRTKDTHTRNSHHCFLSSLSQQW